MKSADRQNHQASAETRVLQVSAMPEQAAKAMFAKAKSPDPSIRIAKPRGERSIGEFSV